MRLSTLLAIPLLFVLSIQIGAQRSLNAHRINEPIIIDGKLDEAVWQKAETASDFTTLQPTFGLKPEQDTKVRVLYDDEALYISAEMDEVSKDSIMTELTQRDNLGNTDFFTVLLDTYGNGTDGVMFLVGATGVQFDAKKGNDGDNDTDWDAIWDSEVCLTEEGWCCEIKLPYSAIRFPNKDEQEWVINFSRRQSRKNEEGLWNPVDPNVGGLFNQSGRLKNIKNIKPPVRLSFSPYFSVYAQHHHDANENPANSTGYSYNGGMDVKYGINDAFTLDMTLIPDFGQVQSDDQVLNLSPFEVRFSENRPFFTEGLEMFQKGGIFYTRRVGGSPVGLGDAFDGISDQEELISFDQVPQLYNATKVSGRNKKGLGIGIFNAIEAPTSAIIKNYETGEEREVKTSPLTNYSVIVLDQNLKNNSYVSLINTNVWRQGAKFYDANVVALDFELKNKEQRFGIGGEAAYSLQSYSNSDDNTGYKFEISAGKISGNHTYWLEYEEESPNFNPNDLGFLRSPNSRGIEFGNSYNVFKPFWVLNRADFWVNLNYNRIVEPDAFTGFRINTGFWAETNKFWGYNMWFNHSFDSYDYFEPRVAGRFIKTPKITNGGIWMGSDNRKKLRMEFSSFVYNLNEKNRWGYNISLGPRYRINNNFTIGMSNRYFIQFDDTGYVTHNDDNIIFGKRDRLTIENRLSARYNFTEKVGLDFRVRHYWVKGTYNGYYNLEENGELIENRDYIEDNDFSFSQFNIDLNFNWRFAPGSDIFIVWKNNISGSQSASSADFNSLNYFDGINNLSKYPQDNSISLRVVYYIDYLQLKKWI